AVLAELLELGLHACHPLRGHVGARGVYALPQQRLFIGEENVRLWRFLRLRAGQRLRLGARRRVHEKGTQKHAQTEGEPAVNGMLWRHRFLHRVWQGPTLTGPTEGQSPCSY